MKDILGTLTLASLAHAQFDTATWKPPSKGRLPMDEDKNGMMGGFSDEPMEFPPFDMGSKGLMPPMGDGTDGMPGPLDMVKMKIADIEDVEDVKVSFKPQPAWMIYGP